MRGSSSLCHRCRLHLQIGAVGGGRGCHSPLVVCRLPLATQLVALSFWRPLAVTLTCCRLRSPGELEHATAEPNSRRLVCPTYAACGSNKCNGNNNTAPLPPRASRPLPAGGSWRLAASCDPHLSRSLAEFAFQGYVEQVLRQRKGNGNGNGVDLWPNLCQLIFSRVIFSSL